MRIKTITSRITGCVAMLLCLLTVWQTPAEAVGNALDYGRNNAGDLTLEASELFALLFGGEEFPLSDAEKAALDALSDIALRYNQSIPDSVVEREYDGTLGVLTVKVKQYEYIATNGKTVSWIPNSVSLDGGDAVALSGPDKNGYYICAFSELWHSDEIRLDVDFVWQVEIPATTVDGLLTLPYTVAQESLDAILTYETELDSFESAMAAYETYQKALADYNEKKAAFDTYTQAIENYRLQKAAYDAYVLAKVAYDADVAAYKAYLEQKAAYVEAEKKYYEFEAFRAQNEAIYDAYELYLTGLEGALSRIEIMESMFLYDSHGWQFYGGVMGNTVDSVLANSSQLENYLLVDERYINNAHKATEALRPLLKGYSAVRSASYKTKLDRYRAEFAYYTENYEEIRDNVALLYHSLYTIYSNSGVFAAMNTHPQTKEKVPHFRQFLAQLYVLTCALDDNRHYDPTWVVSPNLSMTLTQLIEEELLLSDDVVASPSGVTLPEVEVTLPDDSFLEPVEKPVKDFEDVEDPSKKGAPTEVKHPGNPPTEVKNPGEPPTEVLPPEGKRPEAPDLVPEEIALAEALAAGKLAERLARGVAQTLVLHQSISCIRYISNRKTVAFYDENGNKLAEETVEYGSAVKAPDMTGRVDERYEYTFQGWVRFGESDIGGRVSLTSIKEDLSLVPIYSRTERLYEVVWNVDGTRRVEYYHWGETPVCPLNTDKTSNTTVYTLTGWLPEIVPVQENVSYTAQYSEAPRLYTVTWVVGDRIEQTFFAYGELPICPMDTSRAPDDCLYTFLGWNTAVLSVTKDVTYRAKYAETPLGVYNDGTYCSVTYTDTDVILTLEQTVVNFAEASKFARMLGKNLIFERGDFSFTCSPARLTYLEESMCTKLEWKQSEGEYAGAIRLSLRYLNSLGKELTLSNPWIIMNVSYETKPGLYVMAYRMIGTALHALNVTRYSEGRAELPLSAGWEILYQPEYLLDFFDSTENCNLTSFPTHAPVGSTVSLNANCTYGYEISSAALSFADGSKQIVTEQSFVMPEGAVSVELHVTQITYYVTFVVDGTLISEQTLFFGDSVTVPADPIKEEDELYFYTFAGWSPYVTRATGEDRAPVYTATFSRTAKNSEVPNDTENVDRFLQVMVPLVCVAVLLLIAGILLVTVFRHHTKRFFVWLAGCISVWVQMIVAFLQVKLFRKSTTITLNERQSDAEEKQRPEPEVADDGDSADESATADPTDSDQP